MATELLQKALQKPYDRLLFASEVLGPVFGKKLRVFNPVQKASVEPNATESKVIKEVKIYAQITLQDEVEVTCYEILLSDKVRIDQSKVAIQHYVRKLLTSGQAALVNFVSSKSKDMWRFTLVAKDSHLTQKGIQEKTTHPKRFTFLIETGPERRNKTLAERLESLSLTPVQNMAALEEAFSVEKMSKAFFNEYKEHYQNFVQYLTGKRMIRSGSKWQEKDVCDPSPFLKSVFNGDEKDARDFCKKLLGRIIFLYFVQKKRWLGASTTEYEDGSQNFIHELFKETGGNENFFPVGLTELFFNALNKERPNDDYTTPTGKKVKIPYLNGGLFTRDEIDELLRKKGDSMTFPKELFSNHEKSDIPLPKGASVVIEETPCRGFLDFLNAYNFTVYEDGEDDHTVAVDPEMLGHIFENLLEDNKDKGAFYTPKEIVSYMCQECLLECLKSHFLDELNEESLEKLIRDKEAGHIEKPILLKINEKLETVKICDPAIGSGAFPMGLLQEIFNIREIIAYEADIPWDAAKIKEDIIQNSIYGVDIEKGAVDIARLRFWLSLVVDKEKPKALPNLDYKIVVGDSLLSKVTFNGSSEVIQVDWSTDTTKDGIFGQQLAEDRLKIIKNITKKQEEFFHPNAQNKDQLKAHIRDLKLDLLVAQLESMVQAMGIDKKPNEQGKKASQQMLRYLETEGWKQTIHQLKQLKKDPNKSFDHFDWKLDFPEVLNETLTGTNTGFDIVIGNPPYVQLSNNGGALAKMYGNVGYKTFEKTGDIYSLFYEKGWQLLKPKGVLCFITSNTWMRANHGQNVRRFFAEQTNPILLIDFPGLKIFETATVNVNILLFANDKNRQKTTACKMEKDELKQLSVFVRQEGNVSGFTDSDSWVILSDIETRIKQKIEHVGTPLKNWDVQINYGIKTGFNDAFIITGDQRKELIAQDPKSEEIIRPILRGRDIKRYGYEFAGLYLIATFPSLKIDIEKYPAVKQHLLSFGYDRLKQTGDPGARKKTSNQWFETQDSISYWEDLSRQKIVWGEISDRTKFCIDLNGEFTTEATTFLMTGHSLLYLLGFLNSKLSEYLFSKLGTTTGVGTIRWKKYTIEQLQVPNVSQERQNEYTELVKNIIDNKGQHEEAIASINSLIYQDIQLSQEEILFIESQ